ncbi:hypothetical protein RSOLAG1IB_05969 [Rhizoctonia solani AG-1 IB]|uniref:Uncharacterized protein n=1 Tax=Thanatephorus cucumeris (strain AG1-IB / isolate 7/3/14) TaxID=1108050 RepID=M5BR75_THACB|nr:hypothetical protein BN14_03737 [Rhizoctonia solani AG-1 IB]CEL52901.1 hypothetical protein RSOLAG1IB_05969 [Rhizoctonia solani AG-1 IB]
MASLGGFDQVVAISQQRINSALKVRHEDNELKSILQELTAHSPNDKDGLMKATLSPSTVELYVPGEPQKAIFRLNFQDGYFDYPEGSDGMLQRLSVKGWSLAFLASLSPSKLAQVPSTIKGDITQDIVESIERTGSYSLSQILIDLGTANVVNFDFSRSITPGLVESEETKKRALEIFMKVYINQLAEGGHNILGYAITAAKPSEGSLAPVSVALQVMPCADGPDVSTETRQNDSLLFLEMVGSLNGRGSPPFPLSGSRMWFPEQATAVMLVHRSAFWERFLAQNLSFLLSDAFRLTNSIAHWLKGDNIKDEITQEEAWIISDPGNKDSTYHWDSIGDRSANFHRSQKWNIPKHDITWQGSSVDDKEVTSDVTVDANITPGTQSITVETKIKYYYVHSHTDTFIDMSLGSPNVPTATSTETIDADISWTTKLTLNSVSMGKLAVVANVEGNPNFTCNVSDHAQGLIGQLANEKKLNQHATQRVTEYLKSVTESSGRIQALAQAGLRVYPHFVLSGGGSYMMKSPTFTSDCDLQVTLYPIMGA